MLNPYLLNGEYEGLKMAGVVGRLYGYGNVIAYLKREWALSLIASNPLLTYELALKATEVTAYPVDYDISKLRPPAKGSA